MQSYREYIQSISKGIEDAKQIPLGAVAPLKRETPSTDAPVMLIFAPHPDDECLIGALALRLLQENNFRVKDVAVTQGSNQNRQAARFKELSDACGYLGFGVIQTSPVGLQNVRLSTRQNNPMEWSEKVSVIRDIIKREKPSIIMMPHERDWNSTHIGTHYVVKDALEAIDDISVTVVETEFWGEVENPNLMIEVSDEDLANLLTALSFHLGEVARNPYHLLLPAYMQRNVCRGGEVVGGQGGSVPDFRYAMLYRVSKFVNKTFTPIPHKIISTKEKIEI